MAEIKKGLFLNYNTLDNFRVEKLYYRQMNTSNFIIYSNLAKSEEEGYGIKIDWGDLTEPLLYDSIQKLLHEPR